MMVLTRTPTMPMKVAYPVTQEASSEVVVAWRTMLIPMYMNIPMKAPISMKEMVNLTNCFQVGRMISFRAGS